MLNLVISSPSPRGQAVSKSQDLLQSCNTKFKRKGPTRQAFLETNFTLDNSIRKDPVQFYKELTPGGKRLLDYFMMVSTRCRHLYFTQSHIAKKVKLSVRHVQRLLAELVERGVVISRYRHNTSCEYRFNSFFHEFETQSIIRTLSRGVKFIALALLLPFTRYQDNELSTGNIYECRTKTLNEQLYISPYRISHVNKLTRARGWKAPRTMSYSEALETRMIHENNQKMRTDPFNKTLTRIGSALKLTQAGKCDMLRYPEAALLHAENLYPKYSKNVEDKLRWFHGVCNKYCKEKGLFVDHRFASEIAKSMDVKEGDEKIMTAPKSNGEQRSQPTQYDKTACHSNVDLNVIAAIVAERQRKTETGRFKKENEDEDSMVSYAKELFDGEERIPSQLSPYLQQILNRSQSQRQYSPSMQSAAPQQGMNMQSTSSGQYYNPTTGGYSQTNPQAQSSRVRTSNGPVASPEEAQQHMANIASILAGKFSIPETVKVAPRQKTAQEIELQMQGMWEMMGVKVPKKKVSVD